MDLLEIVHKCPFCGVFTGAFLQTHLKLSIQIMSQRVDVNPKCVAGYLPGWNVSHLALCLQFREKTFLRASAIMEKEDSFPIKIFVGHNSLELEDAVGRAKEIELNRAFSGLVTLLSVDEDSVLTAPGLWLPADFEERPFFVDEPPSFSIFDDPRWCPEMATQREPGIAPIHRGSKRDPSVLQTSPESGVARIPPSSYLAEFLQASRNCN